MNKESVYKVHFTGAVGFQVMSRVFFLIFVLVAVVDSWDWPWESSAIEQSGLVNTIVQKTTVTPQEEIKLKANTIIKLIEWLVFLVASTLVTLLVLCVIVVNHNLKAYWKKKVAKEAAKNKPTV